MGLTARQREVLRVIQVFLESRGYAPSYAEIARELGVHKGTVQGHVEELVRRGFLNRSPGRSRSLTLASEGLESLVTLPLLGQIVAGLPAEQQEEESEPVDLIHYLTGGKECFLLRVRGDSMIEAHIQEGDLVVVDPKRAARNGDIVVALVENESTLKTFRREGGRVLLVPENRTMRPIVARDGMVQGVVLGLVRACK